MQNSVLRQAAFNHKDEIMKPYDLIMDMNGFDAICAFSDYFSGPGVYIPKKRSIFARCLELEALRDFNGYNYKELSEKYGFSESHLRRLMRQQREAIHGGMVKG